MNYLLILCTVILILTVYFVYTNKDESENFYYYFQQSKMMDKDDEEDLFANLTEKDVVENVQLTPEERQQRQQDYQSYRKAKSVQQSEPAQQKCKGRCDCCFNNTNSDDRIKACNTYYNKELGSKRHQECLRSNSKYASKACTDVFGKGRFFKTCD
jgi:hypothetical protein